MDKISIVKFEDRYLFAISARPRINSALPGSGKEEGRKPVRNSKMM